MKMTMFKLLAVLMTLLATVMAEGSSYCTAGSTKTWTECRDKWIDDKLAGLITDMKI